ncbi:radical SAM protein [Candidatus Uhrbacteria bacterium]|nr:radical SAM protein [Candidatus Uhrbacteria bacterium]
MFSRNATRRTTSRIPLPIDAVVAVTYLCNSRCTMCDFWKETRQPTLTLEDYRKFPSTLRDINVSGGEPFLHPKIVDIVRTLHETCPKARITISTNGFLTDLVCKRTKEMRKFLPSIGIRISIDGIDDMHERIRRIPQALEKDLATLRQLRAIGVRDLGIAYTMSEENVEHLTKVYDLARREGVDCTWAVAQSSDFYFGGKQIERRAEAGVVAREFDTLMAHELGRWRPKAWVRAYFAYGLRRLALDGVQVLPSRAGTDFFFLDPFGSVYPSVVHPSIMGNLSAASSFADLWSSTSADDARRVVSAWDRPYWMVCTARTAIRRNLAMVGWWVLAQQMRVNGRRMLAAVTAFPRRGVRTHDAG